MSRASLQTLQGALAVFFALFAFASTFSIALAQISFGITLSLFLVVVAIQRYNPFTPKLRIFYLFIGLYVFWMLLATTLGKTPVKSVLMIKEEWLFLIIPIGIYILADNRYRTWVSRAFMAGIILFSIYGIIQHFTGFYWPKRLAPNAAFDYGYIVKGTFPHSLTFGNYYGTAAAFLAAFAVVGWREMGKTDRWLSAVGAVLAIIVTVFSYSRGAILGLIISLLLLGLLLKKRWFTVSLLSLLTITLVAVIAVTPVRSRLAQIMERDLNTADEGSRLFIWSHSLEIVEAHPVFGVGQGNFQEEYIDRLPPDAPEYRKYTHAHNDLLNVAAISGLPGMLFFLGKWIAGFALCWMGWRQQRQFSGRLRYFAAGLIGSVMFFISSLTEASFADEEVRELLMFVWAMGLWQWSTAEDEKIESKAGAQA